MLTRRSMLAVSAGVGAGAITGCSATSDPAPAPSSAGSSASRSSRVTPSDTAVPTSKPAASTPSRTPTPTSTSSSAPEPHLAGTVAEDLSVPWGIVFLPDGTAVVGERDSGRLISIDRHGRRRSLGEVAGVQAPAGEGEGGLLGLALDPDDPDTLFAYLTSASDNRVVRLSVADGKVGRPSAVLTGIPTSTHHHGGRLLFGPDHNLFVSTGDAEQPDTAQSRSSLSGKILRITRRGDAAAGNPFGNRTWSYGHRNIEGLAFDGAGRLWATEFGDKSADELNLIIRGRNYGWPIVEGDVTDHRFERPRATWRPTSSCSPSGLAITRGTAFVGALQGRCLFSVALNGRTAAEPRSHFHDDYGRLRAVAVAPDGWLWMSTSNRDGRSTARPGDDKIIRVAL